MALIFQARGTQLDAYYSTFASNHGKTGTGTAPAVQADGSAGIFGGSYLAMASSTVMRGLLYPGYSNTPSGQTFSIRIRIIPRASGNPAAIWSLCAWGGLSGNWLNGVDFMILTTGVLRLRHMSNNQTLTNIDTVSTVTLTSGTPTDLMVAWDGTTSANAVKFSQDGVQVGAITAGAVLPTADLNMRQGISVGQSPASAVSNYDLNELSIYDTAESHTYATRTTFDTATNSEGFVTAANVKTGTAFPYTNASRTGTYDGSDRWTSPQTAELLTGIQLKSNSTSLNLTGTLSIPSAASNASAVWDKATSSHTTSGSFGALMQKLLTVSKFLGFK